MEDKEIFKGKKLSDLFKEIYDNSVGTKKKVNNLISELTPLVENLQDATLLVPMIKEYLEVGVKNDEHLIKLATVIQRIESTKVKGGGGDSIMDELYNLLDEQGDIQIDLIHDNKDVLLEGSSDTSTEDSDES